MSAPGLLDEAIECHLAVISQTRRTGEPKPWGILNCTVEVTERQQSRLLFHEARETSSPDAARIVLGQPRVDEQLPPSTNPSRDLRRNSGRSK